MRGGGPESPTGERAAAASTANMDRAGLSSGLRGTSKERTITTSNDGDEGQAAGQQRHGDGAQRRRSEGTAMVRRCGSSGEQEERESAEKTEGHHHIIIMGV